MCIFRLSCQNFYKKNECFYFYWIFIFLTEIVIYIFLKSLLYRLSIWKNPQHSHRFQFVFVYFQVTFVNEPSSSKVLNIRELFYLIVQQFWIERIIHIFHNIKKTIRGIEKVIPGFSFVFSKLFHYFFSKLISNIIFETICWMLCMNTRTEVVFINSLKQKW